MSKITIVVTFKLNDMNLIDDWQEMSALINTDLNDAPGFISRESGIDEKGKIYCLVTWENKEKYAAFQSDFEAREDFSAMMEDFARVANLETMTQEMVSLF